MSPVLYQTDPSDLHYVAEDLGINFMHCIGTAPQTVLLTLVMILSACRPTIRIKKLSKNTY